MQTLDEIGDLSAPPGSRKWALGVIDAIRGALKKLESDATHAGTMMKLAKKHEAWKVLEYPSLDMLCVTELDINGDDAEALINAKPGQTIGQLKLGKHGGDRRSETHQQQKDQGDNITLKERGTNKEYTVARLRRDRPDLADLVDACKMSANAAAIEAGFRRKTFTVVEGDVTKAVATLLKHYDKNDVLEALR